MNKSASKSSYRWSGPPKWGHLGLQSDKQPFTMMLDGAEIKINVRNIYLRPSTALFIFSLLHKITKTQQWQTCKVYRPGMGWSTCCWSWKGSCFMWCCSEKFPSSICRGRPAVDVNSSAAVPLLRKSSSAHNRRTHNKRMTFIMNCSSPPGLTHYSSNY